MTKTTRIGLFLCALMLFGLGSTLFYSGSERFALTDRSVTLIDVGVTLDSLKSNEFSSITGVFIDKSTGLTFKTPVDMKTYNQFKSGGNTEIDMFLTLNLDTVHGDNLSRILIFFGIFGFVIGLSLVALVNLDIKDERNERLKKIQNVCHINET